MPSTFLSALAAGLTITVVHAQSGGFAQSCNSASFSGTTLSASCNNGHGGYNSASINLNGCLTNNDGTLAFQINGGYGASCVDCNLVNGEDLLCTCYKAAGHGSHELNNFNLNTIIGNSFGRLVC